MSVHEVLGAWHEFYLMAGTAAVTLVGLLFVALSLHLDVLLDDARGHLVGFARQTLLAFTYVLFVSLMFLVPAPPLRLLGTTLVLMTLVLGLITVRLGAGGARSGVRELDAMVRRRARFLLAGYAVCGVCGLLLILRRDPYVVYYMIGGIFMLLGSAAGNSWHLLVEVGRLKRALEAPGGD